MVSKVNVKMAFYGKLSQFQPVETSPNSASIMLIFKLTTRQVNPITSPADGSDTNTVNQTHLCQTDFKRDMVANGCKPID